MGIVVVDGLDVSVVRKPIKNIYIRVRFPHGEVQVTAPRWISNGQVEQFVRQKRQWISTQQKNCRDCMPGRTLDFVTGEVHRLWDRELTLRVELVTGRPYVSLTDGSIYLYVREGSAAEERRQLLNRWYRQQMNAVLPDMVAFWAGKLAVAPSEWRVREMRSRWGSCNIQKGRIWLNLHLTRIPQQCLEYVVAHELTHLLTSKHNHVFAGHMDRVMADWRERERELRGYAGLLYDSAAG